MGLETIFLDAGGVLVFPDWVRVSETLTRFGVAVAPEALQEAEPYARRRLDRPDTIASTTDRGRGRQYFTGLLAQLGIAESPATAAALIELAAYHRRWNLWSFVPADVVPALETLRALGLRLVVVSNANGTLHLLLNRLGIDRFVDLALDSDVEGVEKPDPRLFRIALERSGAHPGTTLHVGDLYHVDVVGARAAGMRAVLFDAAGLYDDLDCPRVGSMAEFARAVSEGRFEGAG